MFFSLEQIIELLIQYKYILLLPVVVVEGPIITVIAGFIVSLGLMNFVTTYLVVIFGDVGGDIIYYAIGRWGREKFLERWGRYIGFPIEKVVPIEKHFEKHGTRTLFVGKMAQGIGGIFLVAAGLVRMPFYKFVSANLIATLAKSFGLLLLGYFFGEAIDNINSALGIFSATSLGIGIIVIFIFFYRQKNKKNEQ
ncbi:MAG: DedA family protein [Candidatus Paceibacterota bacterium]